MIPIATTEGALVASINKGAKILDEAGGIRTSSVYHGITRAPVFRTKGIQDTKSFERFLMKQKTLETPATPMASPSEVWAPTTISGERSKRLRSTT